jgi:hypothetical protein
VLVSLAVYGAPVSLPIFASAAHGAYHVSERIRAEHERAQHQAIEDILSPHEHGAGGTHAAAGAPRGPSFAHADVGRAHTHADGTPAHTHSPAVDQLMLAAQLDGGSTVGAPPQAPPRVAAHVPARVEPHLSLETNRTTDSFETLPIPLTPPSSQPDPPPRG